MLLIAFLLACGEKETAQNDTAFETDTATEEASEDTGTAEGTETETETDDTQDTEDTQDTQDTEDTQTEDPQWFEAGVYTGTYTCDDGYNPYYGIPMIDVKSTGNVSEIEVLNTSAQLMWQCSITEAHNDAGTEWGVTCTGENSEFFSSAKVYSEGFTMDLNLLFSAGPYGILMCEATFQ